MTSRGTKVVAVLLALACVLVATVGLKLSDPDADVVSTRGAIGRPIELNGGEVTVLQVRSGSTATIGTDTVRTSGLFLVATVRLRAPRLEQLVNSVSLEAGDLSYQTYTDASLQAPPGYESTGDFLFEVDPARLDGLDLALSRSEVIHGIRAQVRIGLGITGANAQRWRQTAGRTVAVQQFPSTQAMP